MTAPRKYTLREALHILADVLAGSVEAAANDAHDVPIPKRAKRARAPRRTPRGAAVLASEVDREAARKTLRQMGVRLPE